MASEWNGVPLAQNFSPSRHSPAPNGIWRGRKWLGIQKQLPGSPCYRAAPWALGIGKSTLAIPAAAVFPVQREEPRQRKTSHRLLWQNVLFRDRGGEQGEQWSHSGPPGSMVNDWPHNALIGGKGSGRSNQDRRIWVRDPVTKGAGGTKAPGDAHKGSGTRTPGAPGQSYPRDRPSLWVKLPSTA